MAQKGSSSFSITINPFNGDSEYVEHFFSLIKDNAKINKWSNEQSLLFLKSKLLGPALKYFLENPDFAICNDIQSIEQKFKEFFCQKSAVISIVDFDKLIFMPNESVKHFAHRLQVITSKVYSDISDDKALNAIKFNKFMSALQPNLRIKLREENICNFTEAVKRAQSLQEILENESIYNQTNSQSINAISTQLNNLNDKINALTANSTETQPENAEQRNLKHQNNHRPVYTRNNRNSNRNSNFQSARFHTRRRVENIKCQICGKLNHTADKCFRYLRCNQNSRFHINRRGRHRIPHSSHSNSNVHNNDLN